MSGHLNSVQEIIFPYSQGVCPFKPSFWTDILQIGRDTPNFLNDSTWKKITQDVLMRSWVIMSDHNVKLAGHFQILIRQCPVTNCYFQHWNYYVILLIG